MCYVLLAGHVQNGFCFTFPSLDFVVVGECLLMQPTLWLVGVLDVDLF